MRKARRAVQSVQQSLSRKRFRFAFSRPGEVGRLSLRDVSFLFVSVTEALVSKRLALLRPLIRLLLWLLVVVVIIIITSTTKSSFGGIGGGSVSRVVTSASD